MGVFFRNSRVLVFFEAVILRWRSGQAPGSQAEHMMEPLRDCWLFAKQNCEPQVPSDVFPAGEKRSRAERNTKTFEFRNALNAEHPSNIYVKYKY